MKTYLWRRAIYFKMSWNIPFMALGSFEWSRGNSVFVNLSPLRDNALLLLKLQRIVFPCPLLVRNRNWYLCCLTWEGYLHNNQIFYVPLIFLLEVPVKKRNYVLFSESCLKLPLPSKMDLRTTHIHVCWINSKLVITFISLSGSVIKKY